MPLLKIIEPTPKSKILIWHVTENLDELETISLTDRSQERVSKMKNQMARKAFLSVRHLLKIAGYKDEDVTYNENGKPFLSDGKNISISHSFEYAVVAINNEDSIGVDIEKKRDKIVRIAKKFIGVEKSFVDLEKDIEKLTRIWGAKESLFKIHPEGAIQFDTHLMISPFEMTDKQTKGRLHKNDFDETYDVFFEEFDGFCLVYVLNID
ncbi:4'-phosphopantetheinyl transferase family protein [Aureivirga sp. CE67]|uniref:4'-phosphopantetheinyl transferase family protein n=1 Tax=Aureivirga sp. CE67 TaxID=1788983 RepID=UPI0018C92910|nr:4'-phosphopantetheinyl transferase superfamily protein [Aureivirga sp. CE67]